LTRTVCYDGDNEEIGIMKFRPSEDVIDDVGGFVCIEFGDWKRV